MRPLSQSHNLFDIIDALEKARIHFSLARNRSDAVSICVAVPGERIEIDVLVDGQIEVSRFKGCETVLGGQEQVDVILVEYASEG